MKHSGNSLLYRCVLLILAAALLPHNLYAQGNFVYTNDNSFPNTVSAFSVGPDGSLTPVPGSPFATGGIGSGGGRFGANAIGVSIAGQFLFAANSQSRDVSAFTIDATTGALTLVPGSPFAVQPKFSVSDDISVAATPDGQFLMASSNDASNITIFSIDTSGALTPVPGSPVPALFPDGIKISPDGKFLAVAGILEMFSIGPDGLPTPLSSLGSDLGAPAGVEFDCSSSLLYDGRATDTPTIVDGYHIGRDGTLTPVAGSPFQPGVGLDSNVVVLSVDDKTLFVSNQFSNSVTAFRVAQDGSLSLIPGSPFVIQDPNSLAFPAGMAVSHDGKFLYVSNEIQASIGVFQVGSDGALTEVAGSPFLTGAQPNLLSLTAFPPKSCSLTVNIAIKPPGRAPVSINTRASGKIPVAILSTPTFDAVAQVDPTSLTFGHSGDEASTATCGAAREDVNHDGLIDLVCQFNTQQTGLVAGDSVAVLKGKTVTGRSFQGSEAISTVPQ